MLSLVLFVIVPLVGFHVGMALVFAKAGKPAWAGLVPVYNFYIILELTGKPRWWMALLLVPLLNFFLYIGLMADLARTFGQDKLKHASGAVALPFIYFILLGTNKSLAYKGTIDTLPKRKKSGSREWLEAILFAVYAATIIRWGFMQAYTIPTGSMEGSLLAGDFLFVSKLHYGPRIPRTPVSVPLSHQSIWGTNLPSYLDFIQMPHYRLPGFSGIAREQVFVFNYPPEFEHPIDHKTNYIKRCVAVGGDTLQIKGGQVFVNGQQQDNPPDMQYRYRVMSKGKQALPERFWNNFDLDMPISAEGAYLVSTTPAKAKQIQKSSYVDTVMAQIYPQDLPMARIFPDAEATGWNRDWYGPLVIPAKGMTIPLTPANLMTYASTISDYEGYGENEVAVSADGKTLSINGQAVTEYTFKKNYYFAMGDNRHDSEDSRFWGFVPEDHVVGKPVLVFFSLDKQVTNRYVDPNGMLQEDSRYGGINWGRIGKIIK